MFDICTEISAREEQRLARVGEHNEEIYGGLLGYSTARINELKADKVI